ncbi:MAG: M23 family metallopeptidase [Bacteroidota bacterium]
MLKHRGIILDLKLLPKFALIAIIYLFYTKDYYKMTFNKHLFVLYVLFLVLIAPLSVFSQVDGALAHVQTKLDSTFQKVVLDGTVSYLNTQTNQFISQSDYGLLLVASIDSTNKKELKSTEENIWLSDRVNPYHGVVLPTPFKIEFDQTTFTHPVSGTLVTTSRFGRRRRRPHRGIDLDLVTGDSVVSVLPGIVRFVGYSRGHGKTVVVRHANEVETVYAHLSAYSVQPNDIIAEGQLLGYGGNTGRSTGSHLHLEVRYKGVCIHPEYVFNFDGSQTIRGKELWVTNSLKSPRYHNAYRKSQLTAFVTKEQAVVAEKVVPKYHRVRKGDTLSHIAGQYHLGVREICRLNSISQNSILNIGQLLVVR